MRIPCFLLATSFAAACGQPAEPEATPRWVLVPDPLRAPAFDSIDDVASVHVVRHVAGAPPPRTLTERDQIAKVLGAFRKPREGDFRFHIGLATAQVTVGYHDGRSQEYSIAGHAWELGGVSPVQWGYLDAAWPEILDGLEAPR